MKTVCTKKKFGSYDGKMQHQLTYPKGVRAFLVKGVKNTKYNLVQFERTLPL